MHVIVVGAGPSGLALSLQLARAGIKVTMLDAQDKVDERPRAAHYAPSAVAELRRAGVLEDVRAAGLIPNAMDWRRLDGSLLFTMVDAAQVNHPDRLTVLPLGLLGEILIKHTAKYPNIDVKWNHPVKSVEQTADSVTAIVTLPDGSEARFTGDYLCGCDGATSTVRKSLFGSKFEGKTWDTQIIATNVYYDGLEKAYNDVNFIIHPEHFYMAAKITKDGLWRVSYGEPANITFEEALKNQPKKYETILPGHPKPGDYKLVSCNPYRIHQRCAESFRVGRITLAADAAHVCNPFGGLGLTGGLVDIGGLSQCLIGIYEGKANDDILDKYAQVRRDIYQNIINAVSSENFLRVSSDPDHVMEHDSFPKDCLAAATDPEAKKLQDQFPFAICHDFSQYFHEPVKPVKTDVNVSTVELATVEAT